MNKNVKELAIQIGKFSVFDVALNKKDADIFTRLCRDPDIETFDLGYPWTGIRRKVVDQ